MRKLIQKKSTYKRNIITVIGFFLFFKKQKFLSLREKQSQIKDKNKHNKKFCPSRLHSFPRLVKGNLFSTTVNLTCSAHSALFSEVWRDQMFAILRAAAVNRTPEENC